MRIIKKKNKIKIGDCFRINEQTQFYPNEVVIVVGERVNQKAWYHKCLVRGKLEFISEYHLEQATRLKDVIPYENR